MKITIFKKIMIKKVYKKKKTMITEIKLWKN